MHVMCGLRDITSTGTIQTQYSQRSVCTCRDGEPARYERAELDTVRIEGGLASHLLIGRAWFGLAYTAFRVCYRLTNTTEKLPCRELSREVEPSRFWFRRQRFVVRVCTVPFDLRSQPFSAKAGFSWH